MNIKNKDNKCILYCLSAFHNYDNIKSKDKNETYHYKDISKYEPKDMTYPIDIQQDIRKFEKHNNIKINVFEYDEKDKDFKDRPNTIYNTLNRNSNVINLLLIKNKDTEHLVWIKDLSKLLNKSDHKMFWCSQCLNKACDTEAKLKEHQLLCFEKEAVKCELPHTGYIDENGKEIKANNITEFKNHNHTFKHPISCYLDFESTLENFEDDKDKSTQKYQKHIVNSVGIKYNCIHSKYSDDIKIYTNPNPEEVMKYTLEKLEEYAVKSYELIKQNEKNYTLTDSQKKYHNRCISCDDCQKGFTKDNKKVVHHDHITGDYISSICNDCNLQYQYKKFLPVYAHNLKGYDSHFLVTALNNYGYKNDDADIISAIPNNEEKYISFSKKIKVGEYKKKDEIKDIFFEIRFIDSFAFMGSSLCSLVENLKNKCEGKDISFYRNVFKNTSQHFKNDSDFYLMIQKGIYPYDYINSYDRLNENSLPSILPALL